MTKLLIIFPLSILAIVSANAATLPTCPPGSQTVTVCQGTVNPQDDEIAVNFMSALVLCRLPDRLVMRLAGRGWEYWHPTEQKALIVHPAKRNGATLYQYGDPTLYLTLDAVDPTETSRSAVARFGIFLGPSLRAFRSLTCSY